MEQFDFKRRFVLKGIGATGVVAALAACGGGNGNSSAANDPDNPSNGQGVTPNGPVPKPSITTNCTNPGYQYPLYIDASSVSTGIPANVPVYAYVTGDIAGVYYYYDWAQGKPMPVTSISNSMPTGPQLGLLNSAGSTNYPTQWADISIQLQSSCTTPVLDLASFNPTNIPGLSNAQQFSGRIWISIGTPKLPFTMLSSTSITQPTPVQNPQGPGGLCLADFVEFSIGTPGSSGPQFYCNTSQVNAVGVPMSLQVTGDGVTTNSSTGVVGQYICSRSALLNKFASLSNPLFNNVPQIPTDPTLVQPGTYPAASLTGGYFGAMAPGYTPSAETSTYFNAAVADAWAFWSRTPVAVSNIVTGTPQTTWYGLATGNILNFYSVPNPNPQTDTVAFSFNSANVTTKDILLNQGELNQTTYIGQQQVGMNLLAAFNRGVAVGATALNNLPNQWSPLASAYYKTKPYSHYAYLVHQNMAQNFGYAFAYDDVGNQEPYLRVQNQVTSMTIQISSFV